MKDQMDIIEKLGGRKFLLTIICVAVGTAVELRTDRGVSASFAGLLAALVTAFGAANAYLTANATSGGNAAESDVADAVDGSLVVTGLLNKVVSLEERVDAKIEEIGHLAQQANQTANQVGEAVVNMGAVVENTKKVAMAALKSSGG